MRLSLGLLQLHPAIKTFFTNIFLHDNIFYVKMQTYVTAIFLHTFVLCGSMQLIGTGRGIRTPTFNFQLLYTGSEDQWGYTRINTHAASVQVFSEPAVTWLSVRIAITSALCSDILFERHKGRYFICRIKHLTLHTVITKTVGHELKLLTIVLFSHQITLLYYENVQTS